MNKTKIFIIAGLLSFAVIAGVILVNSVEANYPYLFTGQKTVTSKGTPVQMASLYVPENIHLVVKAMNANTGAVYVGYTSATALNTNTDYFSLYPGEALELKVYNANEIWLDAESGEGVEYITEYDY